MAEMVGETGETGDLERELAEKCEMVCESCSDSQPQQNLPLNLELFSAINAGDSKRVIAALDGGATLTVFNTPNGHMYQNR